MTETPQDRQEREERHERIRSELEDGLPPPAEGEVRATLEGDLYIFRAASPQKSPLDASERQ